MSWLKHWTTIGLTALAVAAPHLYQPSPTAK